MQGVHQTEFGPEYWPPPELLAMLARKNWVDVSWHNDACPSYYDRDALILWIEPEEVSQREGPGLRFTVCKDDGADLVFECESVAEIIKYLEGI